MSDALLKGGGDGVGNADAGAVSALMQNLDRKMGRGC